MDVSIISKINNKAALISPLGVIAGDLWCGNKIAAKGRDGQLIYRTFGGVIDDEAVACHQRVKLCHITHFYWNDVGAGEGYSIPRHHIVKGCFFNNKFYIAIRSDNPVHFKDGARLSV